MYGPVNNSQVDDEEQDLSIVRVRDRTVMIRGPHPRGPSPRSVMTQAL